LTAAHGLETTGTSIPQERTKEDGKKKEEPVCLKAGGRCPPHYIINLGFYLGPDRREEHNSPLLKRTPTTPPTTTPPPSLKNRASTIPVGAQFQVRAFWLPGGITFQEDDRAGANPHKRVKQKLRPSSGARTKKTKEKTTPAYLAGDSSYFQSGHTGNQPCPLAQTLPLGTLNHRRAGGKAN